MSLRLLQKQIGADPSKVSSEAKSVTQPQGRSRGGMASGQGRGGGGGGGYYGAQASDASYPTGVGGANGGGTSAPRVMAPSVAGGFRGSSAQSEHIKAAQAAQRAAADRPVEQVSETVALKSGLGLAALEERKQRLDDERQAKREALRAKRKGEVAQKEVREEQDIVECEEQARRDSEQPRVKYEAALIVRIAEKFGESGVWMKIAEARARGADIPLDPRKIYLLAHPDKCALVEAANATAVLNAQRPPEMTEVQAKAPRSAAASGPAEVHAEAPAEAPADPVVERPSPAPAAVDGIKFAASSASVEQRTDPEDGQACTFQELQQKYAGLYSGTEIEGYWANECRPKPKSKRF